MKYWHRDLKPILNEWQYGISLDRPPFRIRGYWLRIFCVRIKHLPERVYTLSKDKDYDGFIFDVQTPFPVKYWAVRNPFHRWFGHHVYLIPIKFSLRV